MATKEQPPPHPPCGGTTPSLLDPPSIAPKNSTKKKSKTKLTQGIRNCGGGKDIVGEGKCV